MGTCEDPGEQEFEERLKIRHGCCCRCCSIRAGCWAMAGIDAFIFTVAHAEWPPKEMFGLNCFFIIYVYGVVLPSLCCWLYALLGKGGWPRRLLCRFLMYKIPMFFLCYLSYFTWPAPDRDAWCPYFCDPNADIHAEHARIEAATAMFGHELKRCCDGVGVWMVFRSCIWSVVFFFSFREAHHFFRAHPDNDRKDIWWDMSDESEQLVSDKVA